MSRRYGPYRRAEAHVPERWVYDDYEGQWRQVNSVPEWLHRQREAIASGWACVVDEPVEPLPDLPPRGLRREQTRPFDGECWRCGTALTTRANKRRGVCPTCELLSRLSPTAAGRSAG